MVGLVIIIIISSWLSCHAHLHVALISSPLLICQPTMRVTSVPRGMQGSSPSPVQLAQATIAPAGPH